MSRNGWLVIFNVAIAAFVFALTGKPYTVIPNLIAAIVLAVISGWKTGRRGGQQ